MKDLYEDVLANRYASTSLVGLWGAKNKVILERRLWVATMKAQRDLGLPITAKAIKVYEENIEVI